MRGEERKSLTTGELGRPGGTKLQSTPEGGWVLLGVQLGEDLDLTWSCAVWWH